MAVLAVLDILKARLSLPLQQLTPMPLAQQAQGVAQGAQQPLVLLLYLLRVALVLVPLQAALVVWDQVVILTQLVVLEVTGRVDQAMPVAVAVMVVGQA